MRRIDGGIALLGLTAALLVVGTTAHASGDGAALRPDQVDADSATWSNQDPDACHDTSVAPGEVAWVLRLPALTEGASGRLATVFASAGTITTTAEAPDPGGDPASSLRWVVTTRTDDVLEDAHTDAMGRAIVLAAICHGEPTSPTAPAGPGPRLDIAITVDAGYQRRWAWSVTATGPDAPLAIADGPATSTTVITLDPGPGRVEGATLGGTIRVTNPGRAPVEGVDLTVATDQAGHCRVQDGDALTVGTDAPVVRAYTCAVTGLDATIVTGTATWAAVDGAASQQTRDRASVDWVETRVDDCVRVRDDRDPAVRGTRCVGDALRQEAQAAVVGEPGTCVTRVEQVTVAAIGGDPLAAADRTVTVCTGADPRVSISAGAQAHRTWRWSLAAAPVAPRTEAWTGDPAITTAVTIAAEPVDTAWRVTGAVELQNPSDWQPLAVEVAPTIDGGDCHVDGGPAVEVPAGDRATVTYACALGLAPGPDAAVTVMARVTAGLTPRPAHAVTASVRLDPPSSESDRCADLVVAPTPTTTTQAHWCATDASPATVEVVTPAEGTLGTCGPTIVDVALVGTDTGSSVDAGGTTETCWVAPPTVSVRAYPVFARTYTWDLATVTEPPLLRPEEGIATLRYLGTATQTGVVDGGWRLDGTAAVHNPDDHVTVVVDLAASVDDGGSCSFREGLGVEVPPGGTVSRTVSCRYAAAPDRREGRLTIMATPRRPDGAPAGIVAERTHAWSTPTTVTGRTVSVTDTADGVTWTLGRLMATDAAPFTIASNRYARTVAMPLTGCEAHASLARIVETGALVARSVRVCAPDATGD